MSCNMLVVAISVFVNFVCNSYDVIVYTLFFSRWEGRIWGGHAPPSKWSGRMCKRDKRGKGEREREKRHP